MKKLTRDHIKRLDDLKSKLETATQNVTAAVETANTKLEDEVMPDLRAAYQELNDVIAEINSLRNDVNCEQQSYYDEHSERWQEGEAGEQYSAWIDVWGQDLDEEGEPDTPEFNDPDLSHLTDTLEEWVASPDEM